MSDSPRINVTKTYLPPLEEYTEYLQGIWESGQLTNQGELLRELEAKLKKYIGVDSLQMVTNGTLALQISLRALDINDGEVITTPFSYVATSSSILWENCKPVFVDIEPESLCMDAQKIEEKITDKTKAVMPVHVFGSPCDVDAIEAIANKHSIKVIYDAAHAFGVKYNGKALLDNGDISICSFHSTKLFHTIEGGCIIAKDSKVDAKIALIKKFGHYGDEHKLLGINAKASEFQAAMGLCNLKRIDEIIVERKKLSRLYDSLIGDKLQTLHLRPGTEYNYSYYPVIFESETRLLHVMDELEKENIYPRRYFYPSLNTLSYIDPHQPCPVSEDIANRIACMPLYVGLDEETIKKICRIILK